MTYKIHHVLLGLLRQPVRAAKPSLQGICWGGAGLWLLALLPVSVTAVASDFRPAVTILKMHTHIEVDALGRETIDELTVVRLERKDAINAYANQRLTYSPTMHRIKVLEAYTIDAQGQRHPVPPGSIRTQENAINTTTSQFSDYRYKVVVFPKADVGSVLHLRYRTTTFRQLLPGQMFYRVVMNPRLVYEDVRFTLSHPASLRLEVGARDMPGGSMGVSAGRVNYRYDYRQPVAQEAQPGAVSNGDYAPYFAASSYRDRVDQGRDYQRHAGPRSMVTPEVQAIADRVTRGMTDRRAQIDALTLWVVQNIRYVAIVIQRSGLIPNSTENILRRRYGDCKDHVNLLGALLKARGIDSSPALVNLGEAYELHGPATISPLNHVILYVPAEDLYLDSTAASARPGQIYQEIAGKPVVLTALGRLGRTPDLSPRNNHGVVEVDLQIDGEGRIRGRAVERFVGDSEIRLRDWSIESQSSSMENNVRTLLDKQGERGTGRYTMTDPHDLGRPFEVSSEYELEPTANVPGPAGWRIPVGLITSAPRSQLGTSISGSRLTPFGCASISATERYRIRFADSINIKTLPQNRRFESKHLFYSATYTRDGSDIRVERRLVKDYGKSVCGATEWEELKGFQEEIRRDLRAQFVY